MRNIQRKYFIKLAAVVMTIIVALVFFGDFGEKDEITIQTKTDEYKSEEPKEKKLQELYADITGEVKTPGVYKVKEGTRLFQLIEMAGGLKVNADINGFNQAELITDGQKVIIPKIGEGVAHQSEDSSGLININNADSITLQEIPGVGPATAERIINHRTENGPFKKKEEIKNVSGIGEKTYVKMESLITV